MKEKIRVLHISPNFNLSCGVSKYLTILMDEFSKEQDFEIHFITNGGDAVEILKNYPINYSLMKFSTGLKNIYYYHSFREELKRYIVENEIDIVHSHHRFPEFIISNIRVSDSFKTISTVHSLTKGMRNISYKSDKIIAVSNSVKNNLLNQYGVNENKIIQLYNPINKDVIIYDKKLSKQSLGIDPEKKLILFVGRICKDKGFDILLKSFKSLNKDDIILIVVGQWIDLNIKIISGFENIRYYHPTKNVGQYYSASDVVILPSRAESFPFIMLEAGLYKKPLIGSRVGGISEFIEDQVSGILFNREDHFELTQAILDLIYDESKQNYLAENLHKKVMELDNPGEYCNNLKNIYRELINENH